MESYDKRRHKSNKSLQASMVEDGSEIHEVYYHGVPGIIRIL